MRISDWSSDVCSSDLPACRRRATATTAVRAGAGRRDRKRLRDRTLSGAGYCLRRLLRVAAQIADHRRELVFQLLAVDDHVDQPVFEIIFAGLEILGQLFADRSEEHTSELQSLMRISYAVFCLKKKKYT